VEQTLADIAYSRLGKLKAPFSRSWWCRASPDQRDRFQKAEKKRFGFTEEVLITKAGFFRSGTMVVLTNF
jgi:hypothetical protein